MWHTYKIFFIMYVYRIFCYHAHTKCFVIMYIYKIFYYFAFNIYKISCTSTKYYAHIQNILHIYNIFVIVQNTLLLCTYNMFYYFESINRIQYF